MRIRWTRWAVVAGMAIGAVWTAGAADTFSLDPAHSVPIFKINHLGVSNTYGRFNDVSGTFTVDEADPKNNTINVVVKTASVDTANEARDKHLKTPDFLDAEKFPEMTFVSTSFEKKSGNTYTVKGDFTLHGVTKPIEVEVEQIGTGKGRENEVRMGWETTFRIKRSDYGMGNMVGPVGDDVEITFAVEGVKQ